MMDKFDRHKEFSGTQPIREGFELNLKALQAYMEKNVNGFSGTIKLDQFKGGQSNPTYRIIAGGKRYVLRRKPYGQLLKSAHAVDREYQVILALEKTDVPVAKTYCLCTDESVLGSWFYIMEYVEGRILWTLRSMPEEERYELFFAMNDAFAALHKVDYKSVGLETFGKPGNFIARQLSRWTKQYRASVDEKCTAMEELIEWLEMNLPEQQMTSIIHGDYRSDNLIFHPTEARVIAILDWELSTLGDPIADFAYHCTQWSIPEFAIRGITGFSDLDPAFFKFPTEKEYIRHYFKKMGAVSMEQWRYYMAFSFFKVAGISFGIQGRAKDGTALSDRAKMLGSVAEPLAQIGLKKAKADPTF